MKKAPQIQYAVWQTEDDEGYYAVYNTLADAVSYEGDGCEVFKCEYKSLGTFKRDVQIIKVPKKKKKPNGRKNET